jgi:hypothetical protein
MEGYTPVKLARLAAALCSVVVLAGCGGGGVSGNQGPVVIGSQQPIATTTAPPVTTPAAATAPAQTLPAGKLFTDPQGVYTLTIGKKWVPYKDKSKGDVWFIDAPDGDFRPNVNVVTEDLTGPAQGISLETYMQLSAANLKKAGYTIARQGTVRGTNSAHLGAIEYTGDPLKRNKTIRFLAVVDISQTEAAVVTLSSDPKAYTQHRIAAQPYMVTIKAN